MKRRNLVIATILSLSVAMLTACGGKEESKETTSKKAEIESSITVVDKESTEEETTTEDTTTESTTIVVDNETTGEETTTKVDDTSKKETTTKKQETTTAKPTTTQKETTTKKQEITTQKPTTQKETTTKKQETTTKEEQTTSKREEETTKPVEPNDGLKDTLVAAAKKVIKSYDDYANVSAVAFCDFTLDGVPEFFVLHDEQTHLSGTMYEYKNGVYSSAMGIDSYGNCKVYRHEASGEGVVLQTNWWFGLEEENGEVISWFTYSLLDMGTYTMYEIAYAAGDGYLAIDKYYKPNILEATKEEITKDKFNKIFSDIEDDCTYLFNTSDWYVSSFDGLDSIDLNSAYNQYLNNK